jgi:hypothetical protein
MESLCSVIDDLMAFIKNYQDNIPSQSGCDEKPDRTELQGALEDLYEIYDVHICHD